MTKERPDLLWQVVERRPPLLDRHVFRLREHVAIHPVSGKSHVFSVIEGADWVNVIALTPSDEVILVRQFRHGTERITLEIPGGMIDAGESPLQAAMRELREETGYAASQWQPVGSVEPNPAIQSNTCYTFLALDAEPSHDLELDPTEAIGVELLPLAEMGRLVLDGTIRHALVVAAFGQLALLAGGLKRP